MKYLDTYGKNNLSCSTEKQIVLDGKALKEVSPTSKGNVGLYILNAWVNKNSICVGQKKIEDKSNEITIIPDVLDSLDIEEAVITKASLDSEYTTYSSFNAVALLFNKFYWQIKFL